MTRVARDRRGLLYATTRDGFAYYLTPCCLVAAKGSDGGVVCRRCYAEVDPTLGGLPEIERNRP